MSERIIWRERSVWIAVVTALAVSLGWIEALGAVAVLQSHPVLPLALTLGRTLARVAFALALRAWPLLPLGALGGMMLALVVRANPSARRKVRHA